MNILSSFSDFYSNLSSDGLFFFWIIIFLFLFLIFLSVILILKNKKLSKLLDENIDDNFLEEETSEIIQEEIKEQPKLEIINKIEESKKEEVINQEKIKEEIKKEPVKEETGPYKKNVLREMNARMQKSPINIERKEKLQEESYDYDMPEYNLREEASVSPLEMMEDTYEINDNMKFASEIVERMEEEIKPSNIELTDYEKKQEEEAIISYDELLKVKDKIYNITEDEETDEFIDELKSFRLDLQ